MLAAVIWTPDEACTLPAAFRHQLVGWQDDVLFTFILSLACCSVISREACARTLILVCSYHQADNAYSNS